VKKEFYLPESFWKQLNQRLVEAKEKNYWLDVHLSRYHRILARITDRDLKKIIGIRVHKRKKTEEELKAQIISSKKNVVELNHDYNMKIRKKIKKRMKEINKQSEGQTHEEWFQEYADIFFINK
jgi:hypothetical protein